MFQTGAPGVFTEKKLSNEEKENLQKSAELLSQVVIKNDSNPLGVKIIKDSCYQQLLFAHKTDPEFSDVTKWASTFNFFMNSRIYSTFCSNVLAHNPSLKYHILS